MRMNESRVGMNQNPSFGNLFTKWQGNIFSPVSYVQVVIDFGVYLILQVILKNMPKERERILETCKKKENEYFYLAK